MRTVPDNPSASSTPRPNFHNCLQEWPEGRKLEEDKTTAEQIPGRTLSLTRNLALTTYDAAYLELAQRRGATLALLMTSF